MFGFFKKNYTKQLVDILLLQTGVMKDLANLLVPTTGIKKKDPAEILDRICGEWYSKKLHLIITIVKNGTEYAINIEELETRNTDLPDFYPIRVYNDMIYFVIDTYALFIDYDPLNKEITFCGNVKLVKNSSDLTFYLPITFNPN